MNPLIECLLFRSLAERSSQTRELAVYEVACQSVDRVEIEVRLIRCFNVRGGFWFYYLFIYTSESFVMV